MQSFLLNTYHTEILFSEQDWVVSFDQMIRLSYEMHPANVYLESKPQRLEMDQLIVYASQLTGLGDKFDHNDSASLMISSKTGNWYEESLLSSSVYELQYGKDINFWQTYFAVLNILKCQIILILIQYQILYINITAQTAFAVKNY